MRGWAVVLVLGALALAARPAVAGHYELTGSALNGMMPGVSGSPSGEYGGGSIADGYVATAWAHVTQASGNADAGAWASVDWTCRRNWVPDEDEGPGNYATIHRKSYSGSAFANAGGGGSPIAQGACTWLGANALTATAPPQATADKAPTEIQPVTPYNNQQGIEQVATADANAYVYRQTTAPGWGVADAGETGRIVKCEHTMFVVWGPLP